MKNMKTGAWALPIGVALSSGALAADLPSKTKGPAIEYVRICDAYGKGFFVIPGTDTCLKISGYVRADYAVRSTHNVLAKKVGGLVLTTNAGLVPPVNFPAVNSVNGLDSSGFRARGRVEFDARSKTEFGDLRGFVRYQIDQGDGVFGTSVAGIAGAPDATLDLGYVQWAGITAGRAKTFFFAYGEGPDVPFDTSRSYNFKSQLLAYTFKAGGFSATASLEDPVARRGTLFAINPTALPGRPKAASIPAFVYGGSKTPDLVANLRYEGDWGLASLSGAYHEINTLGGATAADLAVIGAPHARASGWAVNGVVQFKLPMLAANDELFFQAAYANGAKCYLSLCGGTSLGSTTPFNLARNDADAVAVRLNPAAGDFSYRIEKSRGYSLQAGLTHYWTPTLFQRFWASYTSLDYGTATKNIDWTKGGLGRGRDLIVATNLHWLPVKDLDIAAEVSYSRLSQSLAHDPSLPPTILPAALGIKENSDTFTGRLRLQRNF